MEVNSLIQNLQIIAKKKSFLTLINKVDESFIKKSKKLNFENNSYLNNGPFNDKDWINYSYERLRCRPGISNILDVRFFFQQNKKILSLFEFTIYKKKNKFYIISRGTELNPFVPYLKNSTPKIILKKTLDLLVEVNSFLKSNLKIKKILFNFPIMFNSINNKYNYLIKSSEKTLTNLWSIIDLSLPLENIKSNFRKSYKSVVNDNKKIYDINLVEKDNILFDKMWKKYRNLHFKEAGGLTRSEKTWDIQKNMIIKKKAFLIIILKNKIEVAAAFVFFNKNFGFYFSGAFDTIEKNTTSLNHICQYKIIEYLKKKNIKCYLLGEYIKKKDSIKKKKLFEISYHKFGFATDLLNQTALKYK